MGQGGGVTTYMLPEDPGNDKGDGGIDGTFIDWQEGGGSGGSYGSGNGGNVGGGDGNPPTDPTDPNSNPNDPPSGAGGSVTDDYDGKMAEALIRDLEQREQRQLDATRPNPLNDYGFWAPLYKDPDSGEWVWLWVGPNGGRRGPKP